MKSAYKFPISQLGPISKTVALMVFTFLMTAIDKGHSAILIDDFSVSQSLTQSGIGTSSSTATGSLIVGTERELDVEVVSGTGVLSVKINDAGSMKLQHSSDTEVDGASLILWNGIGASGLGVDLTEGGSGNRFQLGLSFVDFPATLKLSVEDTLGNVSELSNTTGSLITSLQIINLPFASFTPTGGTGADFTSIDVISLLVDTPAGGDISLDFLSTATVPEPGTLAFLALGIGGLITVRNRRKNK